MIEISDIKLGYGQRTLLSGANARFGAGSLVALLGRNGSGKSTLLRSIAGLEPPLEGSIKVGGNDIFAMSALERALSVSFVTTERRRIANLLAQDLVALGRAPYTSWLGRMQQCDRDIVERSLSLVGMSHFASRSVERLSDGELQRVMIARALAQETTVILLDEPTAFLDMPSRYELIELLTRLAHNDNKLIIFSTHELDIAEEYCDSITLIEQGKIDTITTKGEERKGAIERIFKIRK